MLGGLLAAVVLTCGDFLETITVVLFGRFGESSSARLIGLPGRPHSNNRRDGNQLGFGFVSCPPFAHRTRTTES
jgi:hypothetical protein